MNYNIKKHAEACFLSIYATLGMFLIVGAEILKRLEIAVLMLPLESGGASIFDERNAAEGFAAFFRIAQMHLNHRHINRFNGII